MTEVPLQIIKYDKNDPAHSELHANFPVHVLLILQDNEGDPEKPKATLVITELKNRDNPAAGVDVAHTQKAEPMSEHEAVELAASYALEKGTNVLFLDDHRG